ncbi:E3 ubiquitin-protein ligase TRIM35-like [Odontesthes bonariensis]|uniref:E3 ubiquitin-protein ligase TRIM35-like n=1 Tax=Odontesthes bonariensis TaxID=219752 RepID=UPI003F58048F
MHSQTEEDLLCPICQDIFTDPVLLACSHSFCKGCLQRWESHKSLMRCPVCNTPSHQSDPPRNLALRNLCEAFLRDREQAASRKSEPLCGVHSKKLRLFCLEHQQPVCVICRDSKAHNKHTFSPVDEAAEDHKNKLKPILMAVKKNLELFEQVSENWDQTAKYIQVQAQFTERQIKEQFKKLHQFLQEEEMARIAALKEEAEQRTEVMEEKIKGITKEIAALSSTIRATEKELRAADVSFLQNYKATVERIQPCLQLDAPQPISGALIDVAKHLGNLTFNIWNEMKAMASRTPVILNPNTAHPELILSEDLTSVRREKKQNLPENPERIYFYPAVLGSDGWDSGTHTWDVEVGGSPVWALGVLAQSALSMENISSKLLKIAFFNGEYTADSGVALPTVLPIKKTFRLISVHLDCDKQRLSFFDPASETQIHTFTYNSREKMFPYFNVVNDHPFKIMPAM